MIIVCYTAINVEIEIDQSFEILMFHDHTDDKTWQKIIRDKHVNNKVKYSRKKDLA